MEGDSKLIIKVFFWLEKKCSYRFLFKVIWLEFCFMLIYMVKYKYGYKFNVYCIFIVGFWENVGRYGKNIIVC